MEISTQCRFPKRGTFSQLVALIATFSSGKVLSVNHMGRKSNPKVCANQVTEKMVEHQLNTKEAKVSDIHAVEMKQLINF